MVVALAACAHNVPQDRATGKDGRLKGAVAIPLENGQGEASGIVTYPGGDRVDWRKLELPKDRPGKLDVKLTYVTPRPGLHVTFDLFDEYRAPMVKAAYEKTNHSRSTTLEHVKGTYYVRVYAPKRGDAGKYKLVADFTEDPPPPPPGMHVEVPDPPRLAEVPAVEVGCDVFDPKIEACKKKCDVTAAANWPGCAIECPDPTMPGAEKWPACARSMACPAVSNPMIAACNKPAPPPPPAKPIKGRIIKTTLDNGEAIVTIGVGTAQGVDKAWTAGKVLRAGTMSMLTGGSAVIVKVDKNFTVLRVHLTTDVLSQNDEILVGP